ncbi:MAG: DUF3365 domain-containing protein [Thermodesulfovibrionales bacterium]|nr:DUF3365 domain-containing protein [Thermodesulfovibrionales bacterium]
MLKNLKLKTRFTVIVLFVYLVSLPIIVFVSYYILKKNAVERTVQEANIMLAAWEGSGAYTANILRPLLSQKCGDVTAPEMIKGFFIANEIEKAIKETAGNYSYKVAALNPRNSSHTPDEFEHQKLKEFREGKLTNEWKGFKKAAGEFYVIMRPLRVEAECLRCHSDPNNAPKEIVQRYGGEHGFGWKQGEINAVRMVYVPVDIPISSAKKTLAMLSFIYSWFFFVLLIAINIIVEKNIITPIEKFVKVANDISRGQFDKEFDVKTNDEIKTLADAFNRMKISLEKAMDIMRRK